MQAIVQFLNFVIGGLVQVYQNRKVYEAQKAAENVQWEQWFDANAAATEQASEAILQSFEEQQAKQVKENERKAMIMGLVIVAVVIVIVFIMVRTGKK